MSSAAVRGDESVGCAAGGRAGEDDQVVVRGSAGLDSPWFGAVIARRVLAKVRSGAVILLHDGGGNRSQTVAALPRILKTLKARRYVFYPLWCL
jgi:peptidoglycan/xylan/chitin deacetylase (PgdA/CDA1 family)